MHTYHEKAKEEYEREREREHLKIETLNPPALSLSTALFATH